MNPGIGHDDIEAAHCFFGFIEKPAQLGRLGSVCLDGYGFASPLHNASHHGLSLSFIPSVVDNNRRAAGGKTLGDCSANTTRASGYQRRSSL
jgi:hypothetical protein